MNASNIVMNVVPMPKAQPRGGNSAHYSNKNDDIGKSLQQSNNDALKSSRLDNEKEQIQSQSPSGETSSSDKITTNNKTDSKNRVKPFKNVLKDKIEDVDSNNTDEAQTDSAEIQTNETDNLQTTGTTDILNALIPAAQQQESATQEQDTEVSSIISNLLITKNNGIKGQAEQVIPLGNQPQVSKGIQSNAIEEAQRIIPDELPVENMTFQQLQPQQQLPKINEGTNKEQSNINLITAKQSKPEVKTEANLTKAESQEQPLTQSANIQMEVKPVSNTNDVSQIQNQARLPDEQSTNIPELDKVMENPVQNITPKIIKQPKQTGQKQNTNNSNNSQYDSQSQDENSQGSQFEQSVIKGGLAQKLGVEEVELVNGKDGSPNSNPVNFATLISKGHLSTEGTLPGNTGNKPAFDSSASITGDNSTSTHKPDVMRFDLSIRDQIFESIQNAAKAQQGDKHITVQLNPPELGKLSIKFSEKGTEVTGIVETSNSQTRAEVRNAIPEIIKSLEQSGVNIKRIDVVLNMSDKSDLARQGGQEAMRDNYQQHPWEQGSNFSQEQNQNYSPSNYFSQPQSYIQFDSNLKSLDTSQTQTSPDAALNVLI